jgi:hypothetical protein|tara:strand:- start:362 stop:646 length:285 start_codon:yes stop_codon:yes gene_type:complete
MLSAALDDLCGELDEAASSVAAASFAAGVGAGPVRARLLDFFSADGARRCTFFFGVPFRRFTRAGNADADDDESSLGVVRGFATDGKPSRLPKD